MTTRHTLYDSERELDHTSLNRRSSGADHVPMRHCTKDSSINDPRPKSDTSLPKEMPKFKAIHTLPDELLVHVLSKVPIEYRISIRRVSQKWKSIISDLGFHIDPLFMIEDFYHMPLYTDGIAIKRNDAITSFYRTAKQADKGIDSCDFTPPELFAKRSEFITSPPISTVSILVKQRSETWRDDNCKAIVRTATPAIIRSEGIRIGDLLDVVNSLEASYSGDLIDVVVMF